MSDHPPSDRSPAPPSNDLEAADKAIGHSVAAHRNHPVADVLGKIGEIGDQGPLYAIGSTLLGIGLVRKNPRWIFGGISMLAAVGLADFAKSKVKDQIKRTRPDHSIENGDYRFETGENASKEEQSFPSGHVACTVAATNTLGRIFPASAPFLHVTALLLSLTRVLKGKHWPLDLIAGGIIGWTAERMVRWITPGILRSKFERR